MKIGRVRAVDLEMGGGLIGRDIDRRDIDRRDGDPLGRCPSVSTVKEMATGIQTLVAAETILIT